MEQVLKYVIAGIAVLVVVAAIVAIVLVTRHKNTSSCNCENGTCGSDPNVCTQCITGFHLEGTTCAQNTCICQDSTGNTVGTPATGAACTVDGANICVSCDQGYDLDGNQCQVSKCPCPHGTCNDANTQCTSCNPGYTLLGNTCVQCQCKNGTCDPNTGHPDICTSCETGWHVNNTTFNCDANTCTCKNGTAATGADCKVDGQEYCTSCDITTNNPDPQTHTCKGCDAPLTPTKFPDKPTETGCGICPDNDYTNTTDITNNYMCDNYNTYFKSKGVSNFAIVPDGAWCNPSDHNQQCTTSFPKGDINEAANAFVVPSDPTQSYNCPAGNCFAQHGNTQYCFKPCASLKPTQEYDSLIV